MLSISSEYELSLNENSNQLIKAKITFADNTVRELTGDDIVACDFDQQVSSDSSFDIGTAIISQMTITLNNHDGRFDACDFTKAQFIVLVGKQLSKGTEWIQRGVYTANQPDSYNGTIAISALDNMSKFEKPFRTFLASVGALQGANASVRTLLTDMCRHCGVTWADSGDKVFDTKFEYGYVDSNATCRQALAYACQALCVNASITNDGRLRTVWYDSAPFEAESDLDGGQFDSAKPYATGASKDGGNFTDYSSGASADGGTFFTNRNVHRLYAFSNITVNTDDVVITGVRVTERSVTVGSKTTNGGSYTVGTEGYVLDVSNNPLIIPGTGKSVADRIGAKVIGLRFRPFSGKHICVPSLEAGDCAYVIDRKQNVYKTYVTRVKYSVNGGMTVSCGAKSASRNSADNAGASTSAAVKARNELHQELGIRDETIKNLGESLANASGLYHTEAKQPDGSTVYYLHDKPTTGQSKIIYKVTASGIGISTDAGKTYATGLSADGNAVLNRIYAIGINADYLTTGRISSKNGNSFIDLDTEEANLKLGNKSTVGGKVIATTDVAASKTVTKYATSTSNTTAPTSGWQDSCPPRKAGSYIWFKIITVMQSGAQIESLPSCISGVDGKDGAAGSRGPAGPAGVNGTNGKDGRGIRSSVPEYYLSTTPSAVTGGSWSTTVPEWSSGKYYWQRLHITWDDGTDSYTTPVVNSALTYANERAATAIDTVNSFDQRKVFNLLTDNGKVKGLFTQDGQLFVNANYIKGGTIDASNVGISNLMKIGTDDNNVSVKSGNIGFTVDGDSSALDISARSYSVGTQTFSNSGASIVSENDASKEFKVSEPIGHDSKNKTWISVSITFRTGSSDPRTEVLTETVDYKASGEQVLRYFAGNVWGPTLYYRIFKNGSDLNLSIIFGAGENKNGIVEIFSMTVNYWTNKPGGSIESGNGTVFLTNKNYPAVLNGGNLFSGEISIPFIFNNTARNYNLYFENGILVSHKMLSPGDPGFK